VHGKEIVARTLQRLSRRRDGRSSRQLGAILANLIEARSSPRKGSFTARPPAPGFFERASGGTLFSRDHRDPLDLQVKLLRGARTHLHARRFVTGADDGAPDRRGQPTRWSPSATQAARGTCCTG